MNRFTSPRGLDLALAFEVGETECDLPRPPGTVDGQESFPIIQLAREMLGRKDSRRGHHHEFDIGDGHARPFCLYLRILHHEFAKVLEQHEKEKKDKYLQNCLEMRKDFMPMVYSVDGIPGREARNAEKRLATHGVGKWNREYSQMVYYVRVRMTIAVVRANSLLICGSRDKKKKKHCVILVRREIMSTACNPPLLASRRAMMSMAVTLV